MVNEKQDSFGGQLAKWVTPILLTIMGFAIREYYISINESLAEIKSFITQKNIEHTRLESRLQYLETENAKNTILLNSIDHFFLKPEEIKLKRKK